MPGDNFISTRQTKTQIVIRSCATYYYKEPLWVIDGVLTNPKNLSVFDPSEIEQISILKSQEALNLFGPNAENGIIIITTKKAFSRKFKIKDANDRIGIGFATVTAFSLDKADSICFAADQFGVFETQLLKSVRYKLKVSCVGYQSKEILLNDVLRNRYEIYLDKEVLPLKEIIVNGEIYSRRISCGAIFSIIKMNNGCPVQPTINNELRIFPNPVSKPSSVNIDISGLDQQKIAIQMVNASGQLVFSSQLVVSEKNKILIIPINSNFSSGVYFIQIISEQKKIVKSSRLVIQ